MSRRRPKGVTDKQWVWCQEYVKDLNATQAALRAGYSPKCAAKQGWENTKKPHLESIYMPLIEQRIMSKQELEFHISEAARIDMDYVLNPAGYADIQTARDNNYTRHIKKIKTKTIYTDDDKEIHEVEIELHDKTKYIDMLAKQHGLTNTHKIETWETEALHAIANNEISYQDFVDAFSEDLAVQLFRQAGVPIEVDHD